MFDNPKETAWPPPHRPPASPKLWAMAAVLTVCFSLLWLARAAPAPSATIIGSPSHLRQIEVISAAGQGETWFYLHNAGYRLIHKRQLIAIVTGGGTWAIVWRGPDAVSISFDHDWSKIVMGHPKGIEVTLNQPS